MTLGRLARGTRALTTLFACAVLVISPAVADAASRKKPTAKKQSTAQPREAHGKMPSSSAKVVAKAPATRANGLGNKLGLSSSVQLAAMSTAIKAAPAYFGGRSTGCTNVTAMLAAQPGLIMAGNFRDTGGNCYVWLNLSQSDSLTGSEICKTTLHEIGHLSGLQHSQDTRDVMFAPFQTDPIPAPCQPQTIAPKAPAKSAAKKGCPPGAADADYCEARAR